MAENLNRIAPSTTISFRCSKCGATWTQTVELPRCISSCGGTAERGELMTEREYIVVSELKALRIVTTIVHGLIGVPDAERTQVGQLLRQWEEAYEAETEGMMTSGGGTAEP